MEYKKYETREILENKEVARGIFKMTVKGDFQADPGQFYMLRAWEGQVFLPRPLSIHDIEEGEIAFLYQLVGKGTKILSKLKKGDKISLLGPLGKGFNLSGKKLAIIGGGIGTAPLKFLARRAVEEEKELDAYFGFRDEAYLLKDFEDLGVKVHLASENGSFGHRGFVTEIIKDDYDSTYICGPGAMMKAVMNLKLKSKNYYSLEAHMGCGFGACLGCSIKTMLGMRRVCYDGPVFEEEDLIHA